MPLMDRFIPAESQGEGLSISQLNLLTELRLIDYKKSRRRAKKERKQLIEAPTHDDSTQPIG